MKIRTLERTAQQFWWTLLTRCKQSKFCEVDSAKSSCLPSLILTMQPYKFVQNYRFVSEKKNVQCAVPEYIHTPPTEGIGISWGVGGSVRPKNLEKCMKFNWNFQRGGEVLEKIPSVDEVWIFSGTTQSECFLTFLVFLRLHLFRKCVECLYIHI